MRDDNRVNGGAFEKIEKEKLTGPRTLTMTAKFRAQLTVSNGTIWKSEYEDESLQFEVQATYTALGLLLLI